MSNSECARLQEALTTELHRQVTRPLGFRKSGATMRRVVSGEPFGVVEIVQVQGCAGNTAGRCEAYVNLGVRVLGLVLNEDPTRVREHECTFRTRLRRSDDPLGDRWPLDEEGTAAAVLTMQGEGLAWLDERRDPVAHLRALEATLSTEDVEQWLGLVEPLSRMWAKLGEPLKASRALEAMLRYLVRERPHANPSRIRGLARELGLPELPDPSA